MSPWPFYKQDLGDITVLIVTGPWEANTTQWVTIWLDSWLSADNTVLLLLSVSSWDKLHQGIQVQLSSFWKCVLVFVSGIWLYLENFLKNDFLPTIIEKIILKKIAFA